MLPIQIRKPALARHPLEGAIESIGPAVIGARQRLGAAAARGHLHAPVATRVDKGADFAIVSASHDNGIASGCAGEVATVLRQRRRRAKGGGVPPNQSALCVKALTAQVM